MVLTGAAGTGKSTLVAALVQEAIRLEWRVVITAPTGRAAWLLRQRLGKLPANVSTLHRFLYRAEGMEEMADPVYGDLPLFRFALKSESEAARTLLVVDEASMIGELAAEGNQLRFGSGSLLRDLLAWREKGGRETKLLLVGDACQLPPVTESRSPALIPSHLEEAYGLRTRAARLSEVLRQAEGSRILAWATGLRRSLEKQAPPPTFLPAGGALHVQDRAGVKDRFCTLAMEHGLENVVLLAYSNLQVNGWNRLLRPALNPSPLPVAPGDLLAVTENHRGSGLVNGERVRVLAIGRSLDLPGPGVVVRVRKARLAFWGPSGPEERELTLLESHLWEPQREIPMAVRKRLWEHVLRTYPSIRKALRSGDRAEQKAAIQLMDEDPFFGSLRAKPGYALTVHRAQGGEWDHVLMDFRGIRLTHAGNLHWAYTALTRARAGAWVIDGPPSAPANHGLPTCHPAQAPRRPRGRQRGASRWQGWGSAPFENARSLATGFWEEA
jgi:ATP-dependent exoDNAse (exonuclease V) alpha subunit